MKKYQEHPRHGAMRQHGEAHNREHQLWSRRDFLSATGILGAGSMLLGNIGLKAFQPTPLMASLANGANDRILVLIRLDGGNDGLNTIIERGNAHYYNLRPTIGIQENNLWALSQEYGMPLATNALQPLWDNGMMKVLFNVGYPEPNYSHFRSYDIVASASDSDVVVNTGWMGRFLDNEYAAFLETPPTVPPALQIGVQTDLVFRAESANMALAVSSPQEFYQIAQTGQLYDTALLGNAPRELELAYVRQTANAAFRYAETIKEAYSRGKNQVNYPADNYLAEQLAIVAKLIKGNLGTKVYMVHIGGFDTHAEQLDFHLNLLRNLSEAVKSFYDDLGAGGNQDLPKNVLGMTFSEFGRTIYENASLGTDHGWGTPMMLFGGEIGNGFVGQYQDLSSPDPFGDPQFSVDFRDVYSTILQDWMGNDPALVNFVLGQQHPTINGLVPAIAPTLGDNDKCALLGHNPHPDDVNAIEIKYAMMQDGPVRLQILDTAGHLLRTLVNEYKDRGAYTFRFRPADWYIGPGQYQYRLQSGGQIFQRSIKV
ncbi:MAG TPA: DUF1501 domain-containing protein [Saprospiraceae bacterium]|nr:DUF1501 domain-containing protein [Saprospiraceae bacterium]